MVSRKTQRGNFATVKYDKPVEELKSKSVLKRLKIQQAAKEEAKKEIKDAYTRRTESKDRSKL